MSGYYHSYTETVSVEFCKKLDFLIHVNIILLMKMNYVMSIDWQFTEMGDNRRCLQILVASFAVFFLYCVFIILKTNVYNVLCGKKGCIIMFNGTDWVVSINVK